MNSSMKNVVAKMVVALGFSQCLYADEIVFPGAGEDLSSGWETAPNSSDTIIISQGGAYTSGNDLSFGNVKVTTGENVTFNFHANRKITLNNASTSSSFNYPNTCGYGFAPLYQGAVNITLNGGYWDFVRGNHFYAAASGKYDTGGSVTITGGAVVTNVNTFYYGEHSRGNTVLIDNAKVYASKLINWATGDHNLLEICNGGEMHLSAIMYTDYAGVPAQSSGYNEVYVHGEGALLNLSSASEVSRVGLDHQSATLRIADKANLKIAGGLKLATNGTSSNCLFSVESGATANIVNLYLNGAAPFSRVVVSNAVLSVNTLNFQCERTAVSNEISLIDGAVLEGNMIKSVIELNRSYGNKFTIDNSTLSFPYVLLGKTGLYGGNEYRILNGANVTNTSVSTAGQGTMFNAIIVSNAVWTTPGAYIGTSAGSCNKLVAQDGALIRALTSSGFLFGADELSQSNRFELVNGSTLVMENGAGMLEVGRGGSFNEAIVEDSNITCGYVQISSEATGHDNKLSVKNSQFATLRCSSGNYTLDPFGSGYGNEFILDGTTWDLGSAYLRVSRTGSNNVFRLLNGAKLVSASKTFSIGETSEKSKNNLLYVGANSEMSLPRVRMMCLDSKLTVSNGTVIATDANTGIAISYREANVNSFSANNTLRLEGEAPMVSTSGPIIFKYNSSLEVAIPKNKFAEGHIPILAKLIMFDPDSFVKIEGEEFFTKTGGRVCLAEATDSIILPNAVVQSSLQSLPSGCRLFVNGKKLYFSSPSMLSTSIIIK